MDFVSTIAGRPGTQGHKDGPAADALFDSPGGLQYQEDTRIIFVADSWNSCIRKLENGHVNTFVGDSGNEGSCDGVGMEARFQIPDSLALDKQGNLWIADTENHMIRKADKGGTVCTIAGSQRGYLDGPWKEALFNCPSELTIDKNGNIYITEAPLNFEPKIIRKMETTGNVESISGCKGVKNPIGMVFDDAGNLYVCDLDDNTVKKLKPDGHVSIFAGISGVEGHTDGLKERALFTKPRSIVIDSMGEFIIASRDDHTLRKITSNNTVHTFAGVLHQQGHRDGPAYQALFHNPYGLATDKEGNIYVSDYGNHCIRKISKLIWTPERHSIFPEETKQEIKQAILLKHSPACFIAQLPYEILLLLCEFIATPELSVNPSISTKRPKKKRKIEEKIEINLVSDDDDELL